MSSSFLGTRLPIVAAPMAGGPSTVALSRAVADAGAFPFLAGGYLTPDALRAQIADLRAHTTTFGVNLFVPSSEQFDHAAFDAYVEHLRPDAEARGVDLSPTPVFDDDQFDAKVELLLAEPVPVVSFTFGLPDPQQVDALHRVGTRAIATITSAKEALRAARTGVDALVVQGPDAGGHSAILDPHHTPDASFSTADGVRAVRAAVDLPVIAAGGVDGPTAVQELLEAGAAAVAVGTLLLRTEEAGTSPVHQAALADPAFTHTTLTRAFTGRPARALVNDFVRRHDAAAPTAYPAIHHLTSPLRNAAKAAGDPQGVHLWAGSGWRSARTGPVRDVIDALAAGIPNTPAQS